MSVIQWFPGHMQKTRREIRENLQVVDIVLEVIDARAPASSANPDLGQLAAGKPRAMVLNKADLADQSLTRLWLDSFRQQGKSAIALDAVSGKGAAELLEVVRQLFAPLRAALQAKGRFPRPARAMVVGMPNVGKSSVINRLVGRRRAKAGAKPGVTRGRQWVRADKDIDLLDLPGVLVPKFISAETGILMAALGAVKEEVYDAETVASWVLDRIWRVQPQLLTEHWNLPQPAPGDPPADLRQMALCRGLLGPNGEPDVRRAAAGLLKEVRTGQVGRVTYEVPPMISLGME